MSDEILDQLADSAARFARAGSNRARTAPKLAAGFHRDAWTEIGLQGWLLTVVDDANGGIGLGAPGAATIARALGHYAIPEPFVAIGVMAANCLDGVAAEPVWKTRLASLTSGDLLATVAWQNNAGSIELFQGGIVAEDRVGRTVLNGVARFVAVPSADAFIVHACGDDKGLFWVPRDAAGLALESEPCPDGSALARLSLSNLSVSKSDRLANGPRSREILQRAIDTTLVACSAELLGVMDGALEKTLEYLRTRKQFGATIGSFQALQHRAVDLWVQRELCEAAVQSASLILNDPDASNTQRTVAASGAKARASQASLLVCSQAVQLHGAIGFAEEYGLGLLVNRALTLAAWCGNAAQHLERFDRLAPFGFDMPPPKRA